MHATNSSVCKAIAIWLCFVAASSGLEAALPAWIQQSLKADIADWQNVSESVVLLESMTVQYQASDKVRRKSRMVMRITKEAGRESARASIAYNADTDRLRNAKAWVISPDGKRTDTYERGAFADQIAVYNQQVWNAHRVVSFAAEEKVQVGSVFAWEIEMDAQATIFDSNWSFLSTSPVVRSVFEVLPMPGGRLVWHGSSPSLPSPTAASTPDGLQWEMRRIPALPREKPAGFVANPMRVSVRCIGGQKDKPIETWEALAGSVTAIIEPRITADAEVKALAEKLVAPHSGRWPRVRAITEFVQVDIPYLSVTLDKDSLAGYRPHLPGDVLKRRLGDCKDKAALVAAMLRSTGDRAYMVLVHAQNPNALSPEWPSAFFNHAIVGIAADDAVPTHWPTVDAGPLGRLVLFDATDPSTPLGELPEEDQGGFGLVVNSQSNGLVRLPVVTPDRNVCARTTTATLADTGDLIATVNEVHVGPAAARHQLTRSYLRHEQITRAIEKRLGELLTSLRNLQWNANWTRAESRYAVSMTFTAERHGRWVGRDMMLVCPRLFSTHAPLPPWKLEQQGSAWLVPHTSRDEVRVQLPDGVTVSELPTAWRHQLPLFECAMEYTLEGREILYRCEVSRRTGVLDRAGYEALRSAYQKLQEAERRPVVLTRAKSAAPAD